MKKTDALTSVEPGEIRVTSPEHTTMAHAKQHISVCVCTYKRAQFLKRLLEALSGQDTSGLFTYSIVVADNDHLRSAEAVVSDFATASTLPISYCVEPRQNIALARNKAIENAAGDFVAFIDDDEFPTARWLLTLFNACNAYDVERRCSGQSSATSTKSHQAGS